MQETSFLAAPHTFRERCHNITAQVHYVSHNAVRSCGAVCDIFGLLTFFCSLIFHSWACLSRSIKQNGHLQPCFSTFTTDHSCIWWSEKQVTWDTSRSNIQHRGEQSAQLWSPKVLCMCFVATSLTRPDNSPVNWAEGGTVQLSSNRIHHLWDTASTQE